MKYLVIEIQKFSDGTVAIGQPTSHDTREKADARFYTILATAALSSQPKHGAIIVSENCMQVASKYYDRESNSHEVVDQAEE